MKNSNLSHESKRATKLLLGKVIKKIFRNSEQEVGIEFLDGTKLFIDHHQNSLELSITEGKTLSIKQTEKTNKGKFIKHAYTFKQGQYLAFIYHYTKNNGCAPSEADMQRYFNVSPPSVHQMVLTLEKKKLIKRKPREVRSIRLLVLPEELPIWKSESIE